MLADLFLYETLHRLRTQPCANVHCCKENCCVSQAVKVRLLQMLSKQDMC